jgi:hypothetical protein
LTKSLSVFVGPDHHAIRYFILFYLLLFRNICIVLKNKINILFNLGKVFVDAMLGRV